MSSRVRIVGQMFGAFVSGAQAGQYLESMARDYGVSIPVAYSKPKWRRLKYIFDNLPTKSHVESLLFVREPRKVKRSKYKQICELFGKEKPLRVRRPERRSMQVRVSRGTQPSVLYSWQEVLNSSVPLYGGIAPPPTANPPASQLGPLSVMDHVAPMRFSRPINPNDFPVTDYEMQWSPEQP